MVESTRLRLWVAQRSTIMKRKTDHKVSTTPGGAKNILRGYETFAFSFDGGWRLQHINNILKSDHWSLISDESADDLVIAADTQISDEYSDREGAITVYPSTFETTFVPTI